MRWLALALLLITACSWRPPRFMDRPPVTEVHDDKPISTPRIGTFIEEFYQADVYVRRELVNGLDPRAYRGALDVSSYDEVPKSSWYRKIAHPRHPLIDYRRFGPPEPPFTVLDQPPKTGSPDTIVINDARGIGYELQSDLPERGGMRTGAAVIASRLVHALGYRTPPVFIITSHEGKRVAATQWPIGIDLGPTPINRMRDDDPNDHLPHVDRRTLRALKLVTAWLSIVKMRPRMLRDAFIGKNAQGHVRHFITGLDSALGVEDYLRAVEFADDADREDRNFFLRLFSLGLSPKPPGIMPRTPFPSVGLYSPRVIPEEFSPSPPFEPIDRLQPGDIYWMAKRMAAIPLPTIAQAIKDAKIDAGSQNWLYQALHVRRATIIAWGYDQTTPCELVRVEGRSLVLADLAIQQGFVEPAERSYEVTFVDGEGEEVAETITLQSKGAEVRIRLPEQLLDRDYSVARVMALRSGVEMPRPFDVHFRPNAGSLRVAGLRH